MNNMMLVLQLITCVFFSCKKPMDNKEEYRRMVMEASVKEVKILALGDSYTKGESVSFEQSFPAQLATVLGQDAYIKVSETRVIAKTGWTTSTLKNNIAGQTFSSPYDIVTLLIGVNNQYQGGTPEYYREEFRDLLLTAIGLAGNNSSKVCVISIPDYGYTPFGENNREAISAAIDQFNTINKQVTDSFNISYFDITPISRSAIQGLVANDGLHPSGKQYQLWMDLMAPAIRKKILNK